MTDYPGVQFYIVIYINFKFHFVVTFEREAIFTVILLLLCTYFFISFPYMQPNLYLEK